MNHATVIASIIAIAASVAAIADKQASCADASTATAKTTVAATAQLSDGSTVKGEFSDYNAKSVIVAVGCKHRRLGLECEDELIGGGISFCAICDGAFYKDQTVIMVGGGNSALQEAILLSETSTKVTVVQNLPYFTGEANINVNFPDYTLPYTAAHEMAHQRGIAREDEANFVAFLVCAASDDEYIRYSGYLNLYEYVANALYSADKEAYSEVRAKLEPAARKEMSAYSAFFDKYRENVAANVTGAVNNAYLTIQGTPGTKSYGMVVDLAVAYLRNAK